MWESGGGGGLTYMTCEKTRSSNLRKGVGGGFLSSFHFASPLSFILISFSPFSFLNAIGGTRPYGSFATGGIPATITVGY